MSEGHKPYVDLQTSGDPVLPEPPIELTDPAAIVIQKLTMTNILLDRVNYSIERLLDKLDKE